MRWWETSRASTASAMISIQPSKVATCEDDYQDQDGDWDWGSHLKEGKIGVANMVESDLRVDPGVVLGGTLKPRHHILGDAGGDLGVPPVVNDVHRKPHAFLVHTFVEFATKKLNIMMLICDHVNVT